MTEMTKFAEAAHRATEGDPVKRLGEFTDVDEAMQQATNLALDSISEHIGDPHALALDLISAFMTGLSVGVELASQSVSGIELAALREVVEGGN